MSYTPSEKRYENMEYKSCGKSGLKLPAISLGLWHNFGINGNEENMRQMLFAAFDSGITHFDLANNYGPPEGKAEENFGKVLNDHMKAYRDEMIISTKAGYYMWPGPYGDGGSRKYLLASLDRSLKRMGIEYVDIFYHHRMDPQTPLEETMSALDTAVKSGKALYAGLSNYDGETMEKAMQILNELHCPFVINQNRFSIFDRNIEKNGILKSSIAQGRGMIIFSPLAQGLLTEKYIGGIPDGSRVKTDGRFLKESSISPEAIEKVSKLNDLAKSRGQTLAQMALSWVYNHEGVTSVLIGASSKEQIAQNLGMLQNTTFTKEELDIIDKIALG